MLSKTTLKDTDSLISAAAWQVIQRVDLMSFWYADQQETPTAHPKKACGRIICLMCPSCVPSRSPIRIACWNDGWLYGRGYLGKGLRFPTQHSINCESGTIYSANEWRVDLSNEYVTKLGTIISHSWGLFMHPFRCRN